MFEQESQLIYIGKVRKRKWDVKLFIDGRTPLCRAAKVLQEAEGSTASRARPRDPTNRIGA